MDPVAPTDRFMLMVQFRYPGPSEIYFFFDRIHGQLLFVGMAFLRKGTPSGYSIKLAGNAVCDQ
jgi:hypothetical protein